jgi:peroxiredoxin
MQGFRWILPMLALVVAGVCAQAEGTTLPTWRPLATNEARIPRNFLMLAHSEEAQRELGIRGKDRAAFDDFLRSIDGDWVRYHRHAEPVLRPHLDRAEAALESHLAKVYGDKAVDRLHQLELQAQGARAFLRPDVATYLELTPEQSGRLDLLFKKTEELRTAALSTNPQEPAAVAAVTTFQRAKQSENPLALQVLTPEQKRRWTTVQGQKRDVSAFNRINAMASEFVDSGKWFNGPPVRLADLRGSVVVVHFYAFQCHNCQANFGIYNRWYRTLREKGVHLIGVQSPETSAERDPDLVGKAAAKDGFQFPVLFDADSRTWNAWGTTMWPTVYVIDKRGYLRNWWLGELNWQGAQGDKVLERVIDRLRAEDLDDPVHPKPE